MDKLAIIMDPRDNLATLFSAVEKGTLIKVVSKKGEVVKEVRAKQPIPFAHKIALEDIDTDAEVRKYGQIIGEATRPIKVGDHVHIQNVRSRIMR